jgi:hypothetical protein
MSIFLLIFYRVLANIHTFPLFYIYKIFRFVFRVMITKSGRYKFSSAAL